MAFRQFPHGVVQLPQPGLPGAIGRLKSLGIRDIFELLVVWLIEDGILSQGCLLVFYRQRITVQPNDGRMAGQHLFSTELPAAH
jgi:hypothetical protein